MKKILFTVFCLFVFLSCEQENVLPDSRAESSENELPSLRSASDIPDAIDQLSGIPVNIKAVVNGKYLSADFIGSRINLVSRDDGSLRQRWNVELRHDNIYHAFVTLVGGNSSYSNGLLSVVHSGSNYFPQLLEYIPLANTNIFKSGDGISYNILTAGDPPTFPDLFPKYRYLQPKNSSSNEIVADYPENKGDLIKWDIIPVDEFRIEDITYDLTTNDKLTVIPTQIATKTLVNDTDLPATRVISFQESITNESSFSNLEGLKVSISTSTSAKVGIGDFFEGSFNSETTSEKSWTYTVGGKETQTYSISESITQDVPPRTTIKAQLMATKYDATLTYIAKLYGIHTGKTIYLKGKWNGAVVQESKIVLTQQNKVLKTIKVVPKLK